MTRRTVQGSVSYGGYPVVGARVVAVLYSAGEPVFDESGTQYLSTAAGLTNNSGTWALDLEPNINLTPSGTVYQITVTSPLAGSEQLTITVPDTAGPHDVDDLASGLPSSVPFLNSATFVAYLAAATAGEFVEIPAGSWTATETLTIPSGVVFGASGRATIVSSATGPAIKTTGNGVTIKNIDLVRSGSPSAGDYGVLVSGDATDVRVENVTVDGFDNGILVSGYTDEGTPTRVDVVGCKASDSVSYGFMTDYSETVSFIDCHATGSGLDGFKIRRASSNTTVRGGSSKGAVAGDGLDGFAGAGMLLVDGLVAEGNALNGVLIKTDDPVSNGLPSDDPHPRKVIVANVRASGNINGIGLWRSSGPGGDNTALPLMDSLAVTGCIAEGNSGHGFFFRARNLTVAACQSLRNGLNGFITDAKCVDVDLTGCHAYGNNTANQSRAGMRIDGMRVTVTGGRSIGYAVDADVVDNTGLQAGTATQTYGVYVNSATDCKVIGVHAEGNVTADYQDNGTRTQWAFVTPSSSGDVLPATPSDAAGIVAVLQQLGVVA